METGGCLDVGQKLFGLDRKKKRKEFNEMPAKKTSLDIMVMLAHCTQNPDKKIEILAEAIKLRPAYPDYVPSDFCATFSLRLARTQRKISRDEHAGNFTHAGRLYYETAVNLLPNIGCAIPPKFESLPECRRVFSPELSEAYSSEAMKFAELNLRLALKRKSEDALALVFLGLMYFRISESVMFEEEKRSYLKKAHWMANHAMALRPKSLEALCNLSALFCFLDREGDYISQLKLLSCRGKKWKLQYKQALSAPPQEIEQGLKGILKVYPQDHETNYWLAIVLDAAHKKRERDIQREKTAQVAIAQGIVCPTVWS